MKNLYRNFSFTLIMILSIFIGFSGNILTKMEIKHFDPYQSAKAFLILSVTLLICSLPDLVSMLSKRGEIDE